MGYNNQESIIRGTSNLIGFVSFVIEFVANIKRLIAQIQQEQTAAKHQLNRKQQMQKQIYQDTISQMTVEQKLKMGTYRV